MTTGDLANRVLIYGLPAAIGLCAWGLLEIVSNGKQLERVLTSIESMQRELVGQDRRLNRLESQYFGPRE